MIKIQLFSENFKTKWDELIDNSINGSFLLKRDFIEYHSHIYSECSLMFFKNEKLIGLIPACCDDKTFHSFKYLTYGGFIFNKGIIRDYDLLKGIITDAEDFIKNELQLEKIIIKRIPSFYYQNEFEDDLHILFNNEFNISGCNLSSIMKCEIENLPSKKKYNARKAEKDGISFEEVQTSRNLIQIMNENLKKYNKIAVHSHKELDNLKHNFKHNIYFFECNQGPEKLGGCVLFIVNKVVHIQYLASSPSGRKKRIIDFIIFNLLQKYNNNFILDYGTSTEGNGNFLNTSLLKAKQELGFKSACYITYEKKITSH